jgi:hypothetical protein
MTHDPQPARIVRILGAPPATLPQPHPEPIPAGSTIYNGPHPLIGSFVDGLSLAWLGEPLGASGAHYAAVLPDDPRRPEWHAHNLAAGAVVIAYVTLDQVRQALRRHYADEKGMKSDEVETMVGSASEQSLWQQYVAAALHLDCVPV